MKYHSPLLFALLAFASCSSPANKQTTADSLADTTTLENSPAQITDTTTGTLTFLRTEGQNHQDSTRIKLVMKGNAVTGQMDWLPHEKDSRKGKINGTRNGDIITATWAFMQEGMQDTLLLKFKLQNNELLQKPLKLNTQTSREQTDEKAAYSWVYTLKANN